MDYILNNLHFIFIHVPVAMLLFSFLFDVAAFIARKKDWHTAALLCLIVGTMGAVASVVTGPEMTMQALFPKHKWFGTITMVFFVLLTIVRLWFYFRKKLELGRSLVYLIVALVGVVLVSYTGHLGGQMVHPDRGQFGPGMQGPNGQMFPNGFPGENGQRGGQNGQSGENDAPASTTP